ncbi:hypothetical protein B0J11DRAFT_507329 [Dendryphion nanum]|uniref:Uncharacterized protein n=1 Tax=Dendryphion nanum TaxID=256645 RepID=A0A9P9DNE3_9PLEO|nr:hypothetical protein B0J11DRAFT_507329 [Dendryphion nanum]
MGARRLLYPSTMLYPWTVMDGVARSATLRAAGAASDAKATCVVTTTSAAAAAAAATMRIPAPPSLSHASLQRTANSSAQMCQRSRPKSNGAMEIATAACKRSRWTLHRMHRTLYGIPAALSSSLVGLLFVFTVGHKAICQGAPRDEDGLVRVDMARRTQRTMTLVLGDFEGIDNEGERSRERSCRFSPGLFPLSPPTYHPPPRPAGSTTHHGLAKDSRHGHGQASIHESEHGRMDMEYLAPGQHAKEGVHRALTALCSCSTAHSSWQIRSAGPVLARLLDNARRGVVKGKRYDSVILLHNRNPHGSQASCCGPA